MQKNLSMLLKQANGGLEALKQRGIDFLDTEQRKLVSGLLQDTASESQLEIQKKLADGWLLRFLGNAGNRAERDFMQLIRSSADVLRNKADADSLLYVCADRPGTKQTLAMLLSAKPFPFGISRYYRFETGKG